MGSSGCIGASPAAMAPRTDAIRYASRLEGCVDMPEAGARFTISKRDLPVVMAELATFVPLILYEDAWRSLAGAEAKIAAGDEEIIIFLQGYRASNFLEWLERRADGYRTEDPEKSAAFRRVSDSMRPD
jgi:hypothetical protein